MEKSEMINELATALAKAQGEMENAKKNSVNPYYTSKYADLAEIIDTCRNALSANGLSVVQPVGVMTDKVLEVTTMLMHSSGQWISSTMNIPMKALDPQAAGSSITYARRYALAAMVGIAQEDDDDDGESAMRPKTNNTKSEPKQPNFGVTNNQERGYRFDGNNCYIIWDGNTSLVTKTNTKVLQEAYKNPAFDGAKDAIACVLNVRGVEVPK